MTLLQAIFFTLCGVRFGYIEKYLATIRPKEKEVPDIYDYIPRLKDFVAQPLNWEIILAASVLLWTATMLLNCLQKLCSRKRSGCCACLIKTVIYFVLIILTVFAVQSGLLFNVRYDVHFTQDIFMERIMAAAVLLWLLTSGIKYI